MKIRVEFLGAAKNVTGSRCLVEYSNHRVLVDCGLHQEWAFRDRDFERFPVPPASIDAVLLTHAHLDHCGYLPRLVKGGFNGAIFCTPATSELSSIVLLDAAHLQEEDAKFKRKRHHKAGKSARHNYEPLYTVKDAAEVAPRFRPVGLGQPVPVAPGMTATFMNSGHILGSSFIRLEITQGSESRTLLFSGDVGRDNKPILRDPVHFEEADYLVIESTYGDRTHGGEAPVPDALAEVVKATAARGGKLLIPSFAVERSQEVLYHLSHLMNTGRIPTLQTFLDSPMAVNVTEVFKRHPELFDEEMVRRMKAGESPLSFPELAYCRTPELSKAINFFKGPAIIIAGSGMCSGGRIKHHLVQYLEREENTLLFVGYQADGTLGRKIVDGHDRVRVHGIELEVLLKVERIRGFSAHADRDELTDWISSLKSPPRRVFVNHGETSSAVAFGAHLREKTGWKVTVPDYKNEYVLD